MRVSSEGYGKEAQETSIREAGQMTCVREEHGDLTDSRWSHMAGGKRSLLSGVRGGQVELGEQAGNQMISLDGESEAFISA